MKKIDYNRIMYIASIILVICFCIFIMKDYINYSYTNNSAPFYVFVIFRVLEFILPSIILIYLYNQNTFVKTNEYIVKSEKFPNDFKYKIAHISDFHNTNSNRIKNDIKKILEQASPDAIVITGDLVDSRRTNFATVKEFLQVIKHIAPIYYVLGNHESRISNIQDLTYDLSNLGINVLRNEETKITKQGTTFEIIGLDDPGFYTLNNKSIVKGVEEWLIKLDNKEDNFKILLTHRPELFETYSKYNIDLIFTGHAHGGQIRIPFIGGVIAPGQGLFPKYTKGIYNKNNTKMIVSRGIGNSKFPFRVNNRPELIFVVLKP